MKKVILLLTLVAVSFSADKWEYLYVIQEEIKFEDDIIPMYSWLPLSADEEGELTIVPEYRLKPVSREWSINFIKGMKILGDDGWELIQIIGDEFNFLESGFNTDWNWVEGKPQKILSKRYYHFKRKIGE